MTEDRVVTWAQLDAQIEERARVLAGLGIFMGERAGVALETSPLAVETLFAAGRIGAALALLPVDAPGVHMEMMAEQLGDIPMLARRDLENAPPNDSYRAKEPREQDPALIV
ncbi:MAG: AMP-binding protein, partial [Actinobacteria bacterium]|nr:AMP-binding protein [Actinomycetota bacterium]